MAKIVTINSEILSALREYKVDHNEAKLYLLGIYFGIDTESISEITKKQVNALGIVEREYKDNSSTPNTVRWKVPLFNEEKDEAFNWIGEYQELFGRLNPERKGTKSACSTRMKKFFAEHPEVDVKSVRKATELYISTVDNPQYLKSSHKFIYEGVGFNKISMLEQYIERIKEQSSKDGRASKMR